MEESLLEHILHHDRSARSPRENLARNYSAAQLVFEGAYASILRIYRFTPGVILGLNQSIDDVNLGACEEQGYDVVRRPSGGSAVIVDPDQAICYSLFFSSGSSLPKPAPLYESFVLPLASRLKGPASVDAYFYLYFEGTAQPVAGHAMVHHYDNAVTQIDGIFHVADPDVERFSRLLKMRTLYLEGDTPVIHADGAYYSRTGKVRSEVDADALVFSRCERDEITRSLGLRSFGLDGSDVTEALVHAVRSRFGSAHLTDSFEYPSIDEHLVRVDAALTPKKWNGQGHCFIDF